MSANSSATAKTPLLRSESLHRAPFVTTSAEDAAPAGAGPHLSTTSPLVLNQYKGSKTVPFIEKSKVKYEVPCSVALIGDGEVGKTSCFINFISGCNGTGPLLHGETQGVATKDVYCKHGDDGRVIHMTLHDTAGQEKHRALTNSYLTHVDIVLIVYACDDELSKVNAATTWMDFVLNRSGGDKKLWLFVGNKCDTLASLAKANDAALRSQLAGIRLGHRRQDALNFEVKEGQHFLVSAKSGQGMDDLFGAVRDLFVAHNPEHMKKLKDGTTPRPPKPSAGLSVVASDGRRVQAAVSAKVDSQSQCGC